MKNRKILLNRKYVLIAPLVVLGIVTIFMAIEAAGYGARLASLEKEASRLQRENQDLESTMVRSSSLQAISEKTKEMGYEVPVNVVYLGNRAPVAKLIQ